MNRDNARLVGALIGLVRATDGAVNVTEDTFEIVIEGLALAGDDEAETTGIEALTERAHEDKHRIVPDCSVCGAPCGRTSDYDFYAMYERQDEVCSLKMRIFDRLTGLARAMAGDGGYIVDSATSEICRSICKGVFALGEDWSLPELRALEGELIDCGNRA